jgi:DNA polymerase type B, organellar and viral
MIIQALVNDKTYSLHHNIKLNNKTKFKNYWDQIKESIQVNYDKDYMIDAYETFKVLIWDLENVKNKHIIIHKHNRNITLSERWSSLRNSLENKRTFSTYITPLKIDKKVNPFIIFNLELLNQISRLQIKHIFVHDENQELFDLIYKKLMSNFDRTLIEVLQDKNNQYIYIKLFGLTFINSHRIFPINEAELNNLFKGKNINESMNKAQSYYFNKYGVDITTVLSMSSLAFKLFRVNFLKENIPILSKEQDKTIRQSYFGGAVHVFKSYARGVFHYDVNSLYPFAMLKPMPYKLLKRFIPNCNFRLNDKFFGYIKVEVTINNSVEKILLPQRVDDKIIYEPGTFTNIYFSEELKLYLNNKNYKYKYLECYEFSKFFPFDDYVNTFYKIKSESIGIERFIAKSMLNNLYGFFGRSYQLIKTFFISNDIINDYLANTNDVIVNIDSNENTTLIKLIDTNENFQIKNNVAIASAITSYARIIMYPYLLLNGVIYSDTDCIFTTVPLNNCLIGKSIGQFKDEMNGLIIKEFISLGPKRYAYWFLDKQISRN